MAADDDVEAVIEFLRKNGLKEAESALKEDMIEKCDLGSFDFEKFLFPVLPPVKIPAALRRPDIEEVNGAERSGGSASGSFSSSSSDDEFVSLGSSTSGLCSSSDFTNPYGLRSASLGSSEASSDSLSQFGTARDYHDYDMQNDLYWHDERDEGNFLTPCFGASDFFGCPSEDKFIMTSEADKQFEDPLAEYDKSEGLQSEESIDFLDKPCLFNIALRNGETEVQMTQYYQFDNNDLPEGGIGEKVKDCAGYGCSLPFCKCCAGAEGVCGGDFVDYSSSKKTELNDSSADCDSALHLRTNKNSNYSNKRGSRKNWIDGLKDTSNLHANVSEKNFMPNGNDLRDGEFNGGGLHEPKAGAEEEDVNANDLLVFDNHEDEYEIFNLRIIHRKNRTGFEENKDLPVVLNTVIAGRYHVTEYLGSAAFSKVFQANDLHTGIDVCLKIIKNDKDFFDQSLDEIKLLKFVNRHDPADERHILRLYDYFYHQEHLFIVCELLKANLYEFQKFNHESGGEPYFTLSRLQAITLQCLEGLEYLHQLGVIHCDLKPENILMKSYRRCEVKIIDLGSSCFENDNLCLYVQSRSYRAPEVILGLPYNQKIDMWSLGCILAELCSGEVLFPNDAVVMILARMVGMVGPFDLEMLVNGQETYKYFTKEYDLYHVNEDTNQLEYIIPEESSLEHHLQVSDVGFIDFVRNLLEINPQRRPSAREALKHPWLSHSY